MIFLWDNDTLVYYFTEDVTVSVFDPNVDSLKQKKNLSRFRKIPLDIGFGNIRIHL